MYKVLVTDAHWRKTLAAVRSLRKKGLHVTVGENTRFTTTFFSKYCSRRIVYPSPLYKPESFLKFLTTELTTNRYDVLIPMEEKTLLVIAKNKDILSKHTRIPIADYSTIQLTRDKARMVKYAIDHGYICPKTYFVENLAALKELAAKIDYPAIIKPRISSGARGIRYVSSPEELLQEYPKVHLKYEYPIIQKRISQEGTAYGVAALFNTKSEPRAVFTYKRIREYPLTGGPSTLRESVRYPEIEQTAISILKSLNWVGVAMVEFKVDPEDGIPKMIEINPRFWGSLQLAILSGVDFPYLMCKMAIEGDIDPVFHYQTGVRCRWMLFGDILHFFSNPHRLHLKDSFFSFFDKKTGYDILSLDDPLPILGRILSGITFFYDKEMQNLIRLR